MIDIRGFALALTIGVVVGSIGAWHQRGVVADRDLLALRHTFDKAVIAAQDDARAEERRLQITTNQIAQEARKDVQQIDEAAGVVSAVTGGLQHAASVYASGATCDPGVTRRGEAATQAAMVLSDMLGVCAATTKRMAESADRAYLAGRTCERIGDALSGQAE